jgi:hypothetical protein
MRKRSWLVVSMSLMLLSMAYQPFSITDIGVTASVGDCPTWSTSCVEEDCPSRSLTCDRSLDCPLFDTRCLGSQVETCESWETECMIPECKNWDSYCEHGEQDCAPWESRCEKQIDCGLLTSVCEEPDRCEGWERYCVEHKGYAYRMEVTCALVQEESFGYSGICDPATFGYPDMNNCIVGSNQFQYGTDVTFLCAEVGSHNRMPGDGFKIENITIRLFQDPVWVLCSEPKAARVTEDDCMDTHFSKANEVSYAICERDTRFNGSHQNGKWQSWYICGR